MVFQFLAVGAFLKCVLAQTITPTASPAPGTGIISLFAGSGVASDAGDGLAATAASFRDPYSALRDAWGRTLISSAYNVRVVDPTTGIVSNLFTTAIGFTFYGMAVDPTGTLLAIATGITSRVYLGDLTTGTFSLFAGTGHQSSTSDGGQATSATFFIAHSVAFDGSATYLYM